MTVLKKTTIFALIALLVIFPFSTNAAFAATSPTEETQVSPEMQSDENYYESQEYMAAVAATDRLINEYMANFSQSRSSSTLNLNVPLIQQSTSWYCGPACMEMVLEYLTTTDYTQYGIASDIGLTGDGAYVGQIVSYLNSKLGSGSYQYTTISQSSFANSLTYSINNNKPVICLVVPDALPNYGNSGNGGHYIVVKGYYVAFSGNNSTTVCMYNDPHHNDAYFGTYSCNISEMVEALSDHPQGGWYIRGAN